MTATRLAEPLRVPFGRTGRSVTVIGQGTWTMERDARAALRALRRGLDLGLEHIDTAEIYGGGAVERLVGRALRGVRERAFLVSKVDPARASRTGTMRACEESLRRLRTDHLDAYLLHWAGPHPLEETFEAFETLVAQGKIRCWGVSNFDETMLAQARQIAGDRIACNQVMYHLRQRTVEHAVLPYCRRHDIAIVGYSPFGAGAFAGADDEGARLLSMIAASHDATPRQVALAFLARCGRALLIPRTVKLAHLAENGRAATLRLYPEEIAALDRAFPLTAPTGGVPLW